MQKAKMPIVTLASTRYLTSGHLLLEHVDHVLVGAGSADLAEETVELSLRHEDSDVVESSSEVVFVDGTILGTNNNINHEEDVSVVKTC